MLLRNLSIFLNLKIKIKSDEVGVSLIIEKTGRRLRYPYTSLNVMSIIGIPYWDLEEYLEKFEMLNDGYLSLKGVKYMNDLLDKYPIPSDKELVEYRNPHPERKENFTRKGAKEEVSYLKYKYKDFKSFWEEALKTKSRVKWIPDS